MDYRVVGLILNVSFKNFARLSRNRDSVQVLSLQVFGQGRILCSNPLENLSREIQPIPWPHIN
jgi:hypothetical protein